MIKINNRYLCMVLMVVLSISAISKVAYADVQHYEAYTDSDRHIAYKDAIYIRELSANPKTDATLGDVVYCFNMSYALPTYYKNDGKYYPALGLPQYTKTIDIDGSKFVDVADNPRNNTQADAKLAEKIRRVIFNGYREDDGLYNDINEFKSKLAITDGEIRQATQQAIWYFSDSASNHKTRLNAAQLEVFNFLIGNIPASGSALENMALKIPPVSSTLYIYEPTGTISSTTTKGFQNLLGTEFINEDGSPIDDWSAITSTDVTFSKTTLGGVELAGAQIEIYNSNNVIVESWLSSNQKHVVKLNPGRYKMHEKSAPNGYLVAEDIVFDVTEDHKVLINNLKVTEVVMIDRLDTIGTTTGTAITFSKTAVSETAELPGATLKVFNSLNELIEKWVSGTTAREIKLAAGEYIMVEEIAPDGYVKAEDIKFRVTTSGALEIEKNGEWLVKDNATVHMQDKVKLKNEPKDTQKDTKPKKIPAKPTKLKNNPKEKKHLVGEKIYSLGDYVWFDIDKDGIQNESDLGVKGITAKLYDQNGQLITETLTDENGRYLFKNLSNGKYIVEFTGIPQNFSTTMTHSGSDHVVDSNGTRTTGIIEGADNLTLDLGLVLQSSDASTLRDLVESGALTLDQLVDLGIGVPIGSTEVTTATELNDKEHDISLDVNNPYGGTQLPKTGEDLPIYYTIIGGLIAAFGIVLRRQ